MVDRVAELLNDLNELTQDFVSQARSEEIAREEVETIDNIQQLEQTQKGISVEPGYAETIVSTAASTQLQRMERKMQDTHESNFNILQVEHSLKASIIESVSATFED